MKTTLSFALMEWSASTTSAHGDAHMASKPSFYASKVWQLTRAGERQFAGLIPGHCELGMAGKVVAK